jgi:phosphatidylglycerophosphate synthase
MVSFWTLPNKITALRIALLAFFLFYLFSANMFDLILSLIVAILIFVLDWADGFFARTSESKTEFGEIFDVIADRLNELTMLFAFAYLQMISFIIPLIFLFRGTISDAATAYLKIKKKSASKVFHVKFAKLKIGNTNFDVYGVTKALILIYILVFFIFGKVYPIPNYVFALSWFITAFCVVRGIFILYDVRRLLKR